MRLHFHYKVVFIGIFAIGLGSNDCRAAAASSVSYFLSSLGVGTHITQHVDDPAKVIACLSYCRIRNFRDDGTIDPKTLQAFMDIHRATGAKICLLPINGDVSKSLHEYEQMASASALLAAEGPNEPNNGPITYHGKTSAYGYFTSFRPVAEFQRDLYRAIKSDHKLAGIPVFASSEAGGSQPDDVGLQFLTIPPGAGTSMPEGTAYADYANTHNYVCGHLARLVDNCAWDAEDPTLNGPWDGLFGEYGRTWHRGFAGYSPRELEALPRVSTETGWLTRGDKAITEEQQGKLFLNLFLDAFKRGWSFTFIYMLRDDPVQGYWGLFHTDYSPKPSALYLHNLTTILRDEKEGKAGALPYTIASSSPTVHSLLLQKSDGTFDLAVWDERIAGEDHIMVTFNAGLAIVDLYDPTLGVAPQQTFKNASSIPLTVSDHPLLLQIPNAPSPPSAR